jgi:hypothetical protein
MLLLWSSDYGPRDLHTDHAIPSPQKAGTYFADKWRSVWFGRRLRPRSYYVATIMGVRGGSRIEWTAFLGNSVASNSFGMFLRLRRSRLTEVLPDHSRIDNLDKNVWKEWVQNSSHCEATCSVHMWWSNAWSSEFHTVRCKLVNVRKNSEVM